MIEAFHTYLMIGLIHGCSELWLILRSGLAHERVAEDWEFPTTGVSGWWYSLVRHDAVVAFVFSILLWPIRQYVAFGYIWRSRNSK